MANPLRRKARKASAARKEQRPLRHYVRLVACAAAGLVLAGMSFALAVSGVARVRAPQQALIFVPFEGAALAAAADVKLFSSKQSDTSEIAVMARNSLRNSPVNPKALRLLAITADKDGQAKKSRALLYAASRLTRRDLITQILLIEDAIRLESVEQAIGHYDTALRTSRSAYQVLFPRLSTALRNKEVRTALKPYVRGDTLWMSSFLSHVKDTEKDLTHLVDFFEETGGLPVAREQQKQTQALLWALFQRRDFDNLRSLYAIAPGSDASLLTSAALHRADLREKFGPVAWHILDDPEAGASLSAQQERSAVAMAMYANPGTIKLIAHKLLFLPDGQYRLRQNFTSTSASKGGGVRWQLRCLNPEAAAPIWRSQAAGLAADGGTMTIGSNCEVQLLELLVSGGRGQAGLEGSLSGVTLTPT